MQLPCPLWARPASTKVTRSPMGHRHPMSPGSSQPQPRAGNAGIFWYGCVLGLGSFPPGGREARAKVTQIQDRGWMRRVQGKGSILSSLFQNHHWN